MVSFKDFMLQPRQGHKFIAHCYEEIPRTYLFDELRKFYNDSEIVVIVGFAAQMIATNNFNSVLKIDVDQRLLPIVGEFKPATWRKDIK